MPVLDRKPIFAATREIVRRFAGAGWNYAAGDVQLLDRGIDAALMALESPPAPVSAPLEPEAPAGGAEVAGTGLRNTTAFFAALRAGSLLGPQLSPSEVDGCSAILAACGKAHWPVSYAAYALATAYHETAHSMQPVREANWLSEEAARRYFIRMYDITGARPAKAKELGNTAPGDGARYCGRGYVQLTGKTNYAKGGAAAGIDLVADPNAAMQADVAAEIMTNGMQLGWFTGKKLADYLPATGPAGTPQFKVARKIINGTDRADDIAGYAIEFQRALGLGDWS